MALEPPNKPPVTLPSAPAPTPASGDSRAAPSSAPVCGPGLSAMARPSRAYACAEEEEGMRLAHAGTSGDGDGDGDGERMPSDGDASGSECTCEWGCWWA